MTKQFAVIGNPIEQSRSPELHHAFAQKQVSISTIKNVLPLLMVLNRVCVVSLQMVEVV